MSLRLKLVSDGTSAGTKVVNAETGEEIVHVSDVKVVVNVNSIEMTVTVIDPVIECDLFGDIQRAHIGAPSSCKVCKD